MRRLDSSPGEEEASRSTEGVAWRISHAHKHRRRRHRGAVQVRTLNDKRRPRLLFRDLLRGGYVAAAMRRTSTRRATSTPARRTAGAPPGSRKSGPGGDRPHDAARPPPRDCAARRAGAQGGPRSRTCPSGSSPRRRAARPTSSSSTPCPRRTRARSCAAQSARWHVRAVDGRRRRRLPRRAQARCRHGIAAAARRRSAAPWTSARRRAAGARSASSTGRSWSWPWTRRTWTRTWRRASSTSRRLEDAPNARRAREAGGRRRRPLRRERAPGEDGPRAPRPAAGDLAAGATLRQDAKHCASTKRRRSRHRRGRGGARGAAGFRDLRARRGSGRTGAERTSDRFARPASARCASGSPPPPVARIVDPRSRAGRREGSRRRAGALASPPRAPESAGAEEGAFAPDAVAPVERVRRRGRCSRRRTTAGPAAPCASRSRRARRERRRRCFFMIGLERQRRASSKSRSRRCRSRRRARGGGPATSRPRRRGRRPRRPRRRRRRGRSRGRASAAAAPAGHSWRSGRTCGRASRRRPGRARCREVGWPGRTPVWGYSRSPSSMRVRQALRRGRRAARRGKDSATPARGENPRRVSLPPASGPAGPRRASASGCVVPGRRHAARCGRPSGEAPAATKPRTRSWHSLPRPNRPRSRCRRPGTTFGPAAQSSAAHHARAGSAAPHASETAPSAAGARSRARGSVPPPHEGVAERARRKLAPAFSRARPPARGAGRSGGRGSPSAPPSWRAAGGAGAVPQVAVRTHRWMPALCPCRAHCSLAQQTSSARCVPWCSRAGGSSRHSFGPRERLAIEAVEPHQNQVTPRVLEKYCRRATHLRRRRLGSCSAAAACASRGLAELTSDDTRPCRARRRTSQSPRRCRRERRR